MKSKKIAIEPNLVEALQGYTEIAIELEAKAVHCRTQKVCKCS